MEFEAIPETQHHSWSFISNQTVAITHLLQSHLTNSITPHHRELSGKDQLVESMVNQANQQKNSHDKR